MKTNQFLFTSESVSEGHPDKIADQISDAVLDTYLSKDPNAKVACEVLISNDSCILAGEITSTAKIDVVAIAKNVIRDIGYIDEKIGFNYATANYISLLHSQSPEINFSVSDGGAGDQGLMFGYACNETEHLMPLPITIAHELVQLHAQLRKSNSLPFLLPDAKSQVTVRYIDDVPYSVEKVVLSTQHKEGYSQKEIREAVIEHIIRPVLKKYFDNPNPEILINPSGSFTIGGPKGDAGLTGRKIIVDTYGGSCPHGGGAFSGKDPSKVDRTGAYIARNVAKHVVAAGLADRCTVQVSYAIGLAQPVSTYVNTHGTGKISDFEISKRVSKIFDFTPNSAIILFKLKSPIYRSTAAYGHFGRPEFAWEKINPAYIDILNDVKSNATFIDDVKATKKQLAELSDKALIDRYNREAGNSGWNNARSKFLTCLREEIQKRNFDSSILFDYHPNTKEIRSFKLRDKVKLVEGRLELEQK